MLLSFYGYIFLVLYKIHSHSENILIPYLKTLNIYFYFLIKIPRRIEYCV